MTPSPRRTADEVRLCLEKGRPSIRIPSLRVEAGRDPTIRIRHSKGVREMGRVTGSGPRVRTFELVGVPVLDGFTVEVGGRQVFELFPADMLVFVDGEEAEEPRRGSAVVLRERGSGALPKGFAQVSVSRWGLLELAAVEYRGAERRPARALRTVAELSLKYGGARPPGRPRPPLLQ